MSIDLNTEPGTETSTAALADNRDRHTTRWTFVSAGLVNVWRYGSLTLDAPSGRLLLRGANGTGKTTALEALCPYLLDLNAQKLAAGKARHTTLSGLMAEGAGGKRRTGYAWLTFSAPATEEHPDPERTWGARFIYGPNSTPKVRVIAFTVPGRPLRDLALYGKDHATLSADEFTTAVTNAGGRVFDDHEEYVQDLASTIWRAHETDLAELTTRLRQVRNPNLLNSVSPDQAAAALRASLPAVDPNVLTATADALAESDTTREAFDRDRASADQLTAFATTWTGHIAQVIGEAHTVAEAAAGALTSARRTLRAAHNANDGAQEAMKAARGHRDDLKTKIVTTEARLQELTSSEEFRNAREVDDIRTQAATQRRLADTSARALVAEAQRIADAGARHRANLTELASDLNDVATTLAEEVGEEVHDAPQVTFHERPRGTYPVGDATANPGPGLDVTTSPEDLTTSAETWSVRGHQLSTRADAARTLITAHRAEVAPAAAAAERANANATQAASHHDKLSSRAHAATATAQTASDTLLAALTTWSTEHTELVDPEPAEQLASLTGAEPSQVLTYAHEWRDRANETATDLISTATATAAAHRELATRHDTEAAELTAQAAELRAGKLLPLPRPDWAGPATGTPLGEALTWSPQFTDPHARALVEAALAAAGILGADLDDTGARSPKWRVDTRTPERSQGPDDTPDGTLAAVLRADPNHPHAATVERVLTQIALAQTATRAQGPAELLIGYDGSYRTGPLVATPGHDTVPEASYVGATQRREAALAHAAALEGQAAASSRAAETERAAAHTHDATASRLRNGRNAFPSLRTLTDAEARRVEAARAAQDAAAESEAAADAARQARHRAQETETTWTTSCRAADLPVTISGLEQHARTATAAAKSYANAARAVRGRHAEKLRRILDDIAHDRTAVTQLAAAHGHTSREHDRALELQAQVAAKEQLHGKSAEAVLKAVEETRTELDDLKNELPAAEKRFEATIGEASSKEAAQAHAEDAVTRLEPEAVHARNRLLALVNLPGVQAALTQPADQPAVANQTGTRTDDAPAAAEPENPDTDVVTQVRDLLAGHRAVPVRTLRERYDQTRAELAGLGNVWTLDNDDEIHGLSTYLLTHNDQVYTPAQAAVEAERLAQRAEAALEASEEAALRDFIIGQLPTAISVAWQRLLDWKREVNTKMRSASASSGVGVQVDITPSTTMPAAVRTIYDICCKGIHGPGTDDDDRAAVGKAIRALIDASDEDTMADKVAAAVDISNWVDVRYEIQRPGQNPKTWTVRTGLSGGERRLVVLAPMLAAVAATYDNLAPDGARLVCLDEVPAEVDEAGREGLARYTAALDLDLMCTSYLWDGAPGAWDGIDAWDFEDAGDDTVVAFPMLVRSLDPFPGDHHTP